MLYPERMLFLSLFAIIELPGKIPSLILNVFFFIQDLTESRPHDRGHIVIKLGTKYVIQQNLVKFR